MDIVHNIPAPQTSFIGRTEEIDEIARLLTSPDCHLLTLVGLGGAGKTRLSIEVARRVREAFPDGVYFVALETARTEDDIISAVIDATPFEDDPEACEPGEGFLNYLEAKRMLLVLDNFEQLLGSAGLLGEIVGRAREVRLLVTSRGALDLQEEWVRHVEGLALPDSDLRPQESPAVQLFMSRAERVRTLNALDLESVIQICRLVEGMPLAIELSAGWVSALSPADIVRELRTNLDILTSTHRNVDERHRSMRAVFDRSLELLGADEAEMFQKLAVFAGGFMREAAEAVAGASLHTLAALVSRSLLHVDAAGRYSLHELLRQYAGEADPALRDRHMRYYLGLLAAAPLKGAAQLTALDEIEQDIENIRRAWGYAVETGEIALIEAALENLSLYCDMRTQDRPGLRLLNQALDRLDRETLAAARVSLHAIRMVVLGGLDATLDVPDMLRRSLEVIGRLGTPEDQAFGLYVHGIAVRMSHHPDPLLFGESVDQEALSLMREANQRYAALGIPYYQADTLTWLGWTEVSLGRLEEGLEQMQDSLAIRWQMSDQHGAAWVLLSLAHVYHYQLHNHQEAVACTRQALTILREYRSIKGIVTCLITLSTIALSEGDFEASRRYADEIFDLSHTVNHLEGEICALGLLAILTAIVDEHYDVAMVMARQSSALNDRAQWVVRYLIVHAGISFAACGLGDTMTMRRSYRNLYWRDSRADPTITAMILGLEVVARASEGDLVHAVELLALAQNVLEIGRKWMERWPLLTRTQADLAARLDPGTYARAWERGLALDAEATLNRIVYAEPPAGHPAGPTAEALPEPLTEREAEILGLVAAGLSNLEIAERLVLSVGTVKVHTRHIYQKLGVGSRTQAVARASEMHLI